MFGIDFLHMHGIAHKRIYPSNIYLVNGRLILGQIGFSYQLENYLTDLKLDAILYYPKEFFHDSNKIDASFDIW